MIKEIIVTKRTDDYHACLKDHPEIWACGKTKFCAIGNLIATHGVTFEIAVGFTDEEKEIMKNFPKVIISDTFNGPCDACENGICLYSGQCEYQSLPLHGVPPRQSCMVDKKFYKKYWG